MTIVVKIWSESLADFVNSQKVKRLMMDIHYLMKKYSEKIILVSSWSVAHWRILRPDIDNKQVLSSLGQPYLIAEYGKKFAEYKRKKDEYHIDIAQILVTHADIEDDYSKRKTFVETIWAIFNVGNILPIINENDPLSTEEMQYLGDELIMIKMPFWLQNYSMQNF